MPTINGFRFPDKLVEYRQEVAVGTPDDIATKDIWITKIRFSNTNAADRTVTLRDGQGTPGEWYSDVAISAKSVALEVSPVQPLFCSGGADIVASGADVFAEIIGYTKP